MVCQGEKEAKSEIEWAFDQTFWNFPNFQKLPCEQRTFYIGEEHEGTVKNKKKKLWEISQTDFFLPFNFSSPFNPFSFHLHFIL